MKKREFLKVLKTCLKKGSEQVFDLEKVKSLNSEIKSECLKFIVKNSYPVVLEFAEDADKAWLAAMGYQYKYSENGNIFIGKAEHKLSAELRAKKKIDLFDLIPNLLVDCDKDSLIKLIQEIYYFVTDDFTRGKISDLVYECQESLKLPEKRK